jgi:hypothetical protein
MTDYREQYTLTKKSLENGKEIGSTEIKFEAIVLDDLLEQFDLFLKASGFCYKGYVTIENDDAIL